MAELNALLVSSVGEGLSSRDADDNLIAREEATREMLTKLITIKIDSYEVEIPLALPMTDFLGNELRDEDGGVKPRTTTIYDAARKLVTDGNWTEDQLKQNIPVLCHQSHLTPVGVCRMCSVHVCRYKKSTRSVEATDRLVPACAHEVQENMTVTTRVGETRDPKDNRLYAEEVKRATSMLTELLMADHHHEIKSVLLYRNELEAVSKLFPIFADDDTKSGANASPPTASITRHKGRNEPREGDRISRPIHERTESIIDAKFPYSSESITVDHDRCILCDRCVRSCSEVKPFKVIGHTGKGYNTRISFDLDLIQGDKESSCVQCGECMNACPTGALTLKRRVAPRSFVGAATIPQNPQLALPTDSGFLSAEAMRGLLLEYTSDTGQVRKFHPFRDIPFSYLKWNEGAVRRRILTKGEVLCKYDDYGSTAFLLHKGTVLIQAFKKKPAPTGFFSRLSGSKAPRVEVEEDGKPFPLKPSGLIVGELAALSSQRRNATVTAAEDGVEVFELTRNILDMAQRSPSARNVFASVYTSNAIYGAFKSWQFFEALRDDEKAKVIKILKGTAKTTKEDGSIERLRTRLVRYQAGETIMHQGDPAEDFFIIRSGFVKVLRESDGVDVVINRLPMTIQPVKEADKPKPPRKDAEKPAQPRKDVEKPKVVNYFGEIALLAKHPRLAKYLTDEAEKAGRRTASVVALDPVEIVRVPRELFERLCKALPDVHEKLVTECINTKRADRARRREATVENQMSQFVQQGIYQGQKMLVLDLESCVRCDECTRACADSHSGVDLLAHGSGTVSRLIREGERFGDFLIAGSCRSCHKPYCMEGCPVDAIHRAGDKLEVIIDNHCIGCGLCATNCPYGSIQMVPNLKDVKDAETGESAKKAKLKAVNCDLCHDLVPAGADTFCVAACPHDAAFRWTGDEVLNKVNEHAKAKKAAAEKSLKAANTKTLPMATAS